MRLEAASTALFHAFGVAALLCGLGGQMWDAGFAPGEQRFRSLVVSRKFPSSSPKRSFPMMV